MASALAERQRMPTRFIRCGTTWLTALSTAPLADRVTGGAEGLVSYPVTVGREVAVQIVHGMALARRASMRPGKPLAFDDLIHLIGRQSIELDGAPRR